MCEEGLHEGRLRPPVRQKACQEVSHHQSRYFSNASFFCIIFISGLGLTYTMLLNGEWKGYYARWAALRKLLLQFLSVDSGCKKQILSLGAGFDTTYFQLQEEGFAPHMYVELDFKEVSKWRSPQGFVRLSSISGFRIVREGNNLGEI